MEPFPPWRPDSPRSPPLSPRERPPDEAMEPLSEPACPTSPACARLQQPSAAQAQAQAQPAGRDPPRSVPPGFSPDAAPTGFPPYFPPPPPSQGSSSSGAGDDDSENEQIERKVTSLAAPQPTCLPSAYHAPSYDDFLQQYRSALGRIADDTAAGGSWIDQAIVRAGDSLLSETPADNPGATMQRASSSFGFSGPSTPYSPIGDSSAAGPSSSSSSAGASSTSQPSRGAGHRRRRSLLAAGLRVSPEDDMSQPQTRLRSSMLLHGQSPLRRSWQPDEDDAKSGTEYDRRGDGKQRQGGDKGKGKLTDGGGHS